MKYKPFAQVHVVIYGRTKSFSSLSDALHFFWFKYCSLTAVNDTVRFIDRLCERAMD
jgi:hypothetical protein